MKKVDIKHQSDSSCSPDSYNHNTGSKKDWKFQIAQDGELFFIRRSKKSSTSSSNCQTNNSSTFSSQSKSNELNFLKLLTIKNANINKEVYLIVSSMDRYRFGRRSSIIESMLGFGVIPFSDNFECLMIANIIDNSLKLEFPYLQEGDWFKSIDNIEVRTENIDKLLLQYSRATKVKLTFKSSHIPHKSTEENNFLMGDVHSFADFAKQKQLFENRVPQDDEHYVFLTLIINRQYFQAEQYECLFYYPFLSNNFLYNAKGSFLTLDSVITNNLNSKAMQSTITVNHIKYFITYGHVNDTLIVCAFASTHQDKQRAKSNSDDFINFLKFDSPDYQNVEGRQYLDQVCDVFRNNIIKQNTNFAWCSCFLTCSSLSMPLPKEAQLRICDALSEFQSMDHKKWNETHKMSSDLIVCGTALYYGKFLLTSNLPVHIRIEIECYLRVKGLTSYQNIKEMYIWEKMKCKLDTTNKHYVAICLRNDLMLITVFRSPQQQVSISNESCIPYMEEITNTVDYLLSTGIDCVSQSWIDSAKRPSLKRISQCSSLHKFSIQKDISLDNIESNNIMFQESPVHSNTMTSSQFEGGLRRNFESGSVFDGINDNKEYNKNCEYIGPLLNEVRNMMPMNWTTGWSNDLKFYLHWNCSEALLLSPLKPMSSQMHLEIIKETILNIHNLFHSHSNCKKRLKDASWNRNVVLREHGVSVNLKNSASSEKETFFIIGRLFAFPLKEIFVCFGPNYSQNLVELAFRMSLLNAG